MSHALETAAQNHNDNKEYKEKLRQKSIEIFRKFLHILVYLP